MLSAPKPGQRVQLWYGKLHRATMPHHGKIGTVEVPGKGRPRTHVVRLEDGMRVVAPAGNLRTTAKPTRPAMPWCSTTTTSITTRGRIASTTSPGATDELPQPGDLANAGGPRLRLWALHRMVLVMLQDYAPFETSFSGGITVAVGDGKGDRTLDAIAGAEVGGGPSGQVFNGLTQRPIISSSR